MQSGEYSRGRRWEKGLLRSQPHFKIRAARGANEQFLEAYGSQGSLVYRLDREKPKWYVGELRAAGASGTTSSR